MTKLMKTRTVLLVLFIAAFLFVAYCGFSAFLSPNLVLEKERGLSNYRGFLETRAWPEGDAFHLGDSISYFIEVEYDTQTIEEIDKSSIDKNLVLEPFEIKSQSEREFSIDSHTKVYLREYKIQLVSGEPDKLYLFPPVPLRYKLINSGYFDRKMVLQPIPVGSRFPPDNQGIGLKPIDGTVVNKSRQYFPLLIIGLGVFCGVWGITEVYKKIIRRKKEAEDFRKRLAGIEDIYNAYQELLKESADPKYVLRHVYQMMRTLLSRKEGIDWLSPDMELIPEAIKGPTSRVLDLSQRAYDKQPLGKADPEPAEVLYQLGEIFDFYVWKGGVR